MDILNHLSARCMPSSWQPTKAAAEPGEAPSFLLPSRAARAMPGIAALLASLWQRKKQCLPPGPARSGFTQVAELKDGEITEYTLTPEDVGIKSQSLIGLSVDGSEASLALIRNALSKRDNEAAEKAADMIALNAGAALYVAGVASSLKNGVALAEDVIHGGRALEKMQELAAFTQGMTQ